MNLALAGRVALVTGGTRGIGRAVVDRLLAEGCQVVGTSRTEESAVLAAEDLAKSSDQVRFVAAPLEDPEAPARAVAAAIDAFGGLDVLVCNAGHHPYAGYEEFGRGNWMQLLETKLIAYERTIAAALPALRARGGGSVVIISGVTALAPSPDRPDVGAVCAALLNITRFFAARVAADGITVNAISPGAVRTRRHEMRVLRLVNGGLSPEQAEATLVESSPLHHITSPDEVALLVALMCSPRLRAMTGANVVIDAGRSLTVGA